MLPQNKFQDVVFTVFMAFVMVYAMICYNISLNVGGMQNFVFLAAPAQGKRSEPWDVRLAS